MRRGGGLALGADRGLPHLCLLQLVSFPDDAREGNLLRVMM